MKRVSVNVQSALPILLASFALQVLGRPAAPVGLLVNGVSRPLVIERDAARFTWRSADGGRGARQTAYQIRVASSPEGLAAGKGDWWDSGKIDSDRSASVEYAGKPLPPATRFWWRVRVWDQTGKPSPYSAPAFFDTGLNQGEWRAHYVWDGTTNVNNFAYFRKAFTVTRKPSLAKVYVTAHNDYLLYLNGQILGRGPARCDPYHYGQYNGYDITRLVNTGTNIFAAMGHWQGTWNDSGINAKPAFLLEARLDYPNGSHSTFGTDASWKVLAHTPFIETNAYFGWGIPKRTAPPPKHRANPPHMWTIPDESTHLPPKCVECDWMNGGASNRAAIRFDSRREPIGWEKVGFDDSKWASASVVDRSLYHLFAQMAPLEREQAALKPVSVTRINGAWLVDFGRCIDGWPKLTMHANHSGDVIRVEYFQMTGGRKPAGWDEYICHGGRETWDADFGRHTSFQVIKITGYAGKLRASEVRGMWAYCDADVAGRFRCSSPLLNAIYEMCERSARQNIQQGMISVDADREQSPWTADSWNIGNVLLYNDRDTMMMDKVVRDYAGEQLPNGDFPSCGPAQRFSQIPEWSMYWPMLLWQQYLFSGDQTLLREMAPHLRRFMEWLKPYQNPTNKLLNPPGWRISEWAAIHKMPSGGDNVATACQYYDNLRIASRIFSILGQTNQSAEDWQQAEAVKKGINANLFNGQYYLPRTDTNEKWALASAWPLRFNLERPADKSKILAAIERIGKPRIGGYGGDAFYSGLLNAGGGAYAVRDLERYRPMLDSNKANWEGFIPGRGEVNHAWTAYPGYLFQKYFLGVQPTSGGFATFDVRPDTSGLTFAEGAVPTVKGLITTRWEKGAHGQLSLSVKVPANTQASIYLPKPANGTFTLTESGKRLWPAGSPVNDPGVLAVQEQDASVECVVGAGVYRFKEIPTP
jgi:alpha-L-rhamnosidase